MNRAGAALTGIATDMGAREPEILPKELHKQQSRLDIRGDRLSVHGHGYRCHEILPCIIFRRLVADAWQTPDDATSAKIYCGIRAKVHIEPPVGIFCDA